MAPKKGIKKVAKKKTVKKNIRNKLLKKKDDTNINQSVMTTPNTAINPATTIAQLHGPNNLRAQLLARASMTPSFGFAPQQYGNLTNEKRIDQLRNDNNTINSQIASSNAAIESLKSENAKLKSELDEKKKLKKEAQKRFDKAQNDREMMEDAVNESERIDMKTKKEEQRKQTAELRKAEQTRDNKIIQYKKEADDLESQVHESKMKHQELQEVYERNKEYHRLQQLKEEHKRLVNENVTLMDVMKAPEFASPNEEIMKMQKEILKEQYQKELNEQMIQKQKELNFMKIQSQSLPKDELEALTKQHAEQMKKIDTEIINTKEASYEHQKIIDEYQFNLDKRQQLDRELLEAKNKQTLLQEEAAKVETQNKGDLGKEVKSKLTTFAKQKVTNDEKERRIERAKEMTKLKENEFQNQVMINELNKGISEEEQKEIQQHVATLAEQEKRKRQIDLLSQYNDAQRTQIRNDAIYNELNRGFDEDEQKQIKYMGEVAIKLDEQKKQISALQYNRDTQAEEAKARAQKDFYESEEYNKMFNERVAKETQAAQLQKQKDEQELMMKAQKQLNEARLAQQVSNNFTANSLSMAQQVDFLANNMLKPLLDETDKRREIVNRINAIKLQHQNEWNAFIQHNHKIPEMINGGGYMNVSAEELESIYDKFMEFMRQMNQQRQQQQQPVGQITFGQQQQSFGSNPFGQQQFGQQRFGSNPYVHDYSDDD